jgi:hypothetical protein
MWAWAAVGQGFGRAIRSAEFVAGTRRRWPVKPLPKPQDPAAREFALASSSGLN